MTSPRSRTRSPLAILVALALSALVAAPAVGGEGFGGLNKTRTNLVRKKPPKVFIEGTEIAIEVKNRVKDGGQAAAIELEKLVESRLLNADTRLRPSAKPQTVIELTLLESKGGERAEQREVADLDMKASSLAELNDDNVIVDDKMVDGKVVTYELSVAYKVIDRRNGATLDSDTYSSQYSEWFRDGRDRPMQSTLEIERAQEVAEHIAGRLAPSVEEITVLVPRGRLKDLEMLAAGGLWLRYLEAVERVPPARNPKDESYRQYALGLAHEALAYQNVDPATALRYLHQAAVHYSDAITANPTEQAFILGSDGFLAAESDRRWLERVKDKVRLPSTLPPLERIQVAVGDYAGLVEFQEQVAAIRQIGAKGGGTANGGAAALDNAAVIDMVKAGLSDEIVLTAIDTAPAHAFDTTPQGLIELTRAAVPSAIISRIQQLGSAR